MKDKIVVGVFVALVVGLILLMPPLVLEPALSRTEARWVSVQEVCDIERMTSFILDCAKAANPQSDEEGEDLVVECQRVALSAFCTERCVRDYGSTTVSCWVR